MKSYLYKEHVVADMPEADEAEELFGGMSAAEQPQEKLIDLNDHRSDFRAIQEMLGDRSLFNFAAEKKVKLQENVNPQTFKRGIILPEDAVSYHYGDIHDCDIDYDDAVKTVIRGLQRGENAFGIFHGDMIDPLYYYQKDSMT